jgi:putative ABC transport system permease protein
VSFAGVLVGLVLVVPAAVRALGAPLRGVPGRLAVDNAVRDPGRAAATGAALLVGVTLLTMASAGASSGESTALREIDEQYAIDLVVSTGGQYAEDGTGRVDALPLPAEARARLAGIEGVTAARTVDGAYLTLGDAEVPTAAIGLDPGRDGDVVRGAEQLAGLVPGALGMSDSMRALHGLAPGDTVEVAGPGGSAELAVVPFAAGYTVVLHMSDLGSLGGDAVAAGTALLRLADDADLRPVVAAVSDLADEAGLQLEGSAAERGRVVQVLDMLVLVTTALLGVALVIAVVGIANTLALSVVERRHEHALLRALGLTRGQVRSVLVTEAVLLALAGTVLGLVLGLVYAAFGVQTVLPTGVDLRPDVPWGRLAVAVGVAVVAGTLAGLVPAHRAARVSPVEGMAAV